MSDTLIIPNPFRTARVFAVGLRMTRNDAASRPSYSFRREYYYYYYNIRVNYYFSDDRYTFMRSVFLSIYFYHLFRILIFLYIRFDFSKRSITRSVTGENPFFHYILHINNIRLFVVVIIIIILITFRYGVENGKNGNIQT